MEISFFLKIYHQKWNYGMALSVNLFPWESEHTEPQTRSSQPVSGRFQVYDHRYLSQTWQDNLFCQLSLFGGPGSTRLCRVHFLCLLRQHSWSFISEGGETHGTATGSPDSCVLFWKSTGCGCAQSNCFFFLQLNVWASLSWMKPCRHCLFSNSVGLQAWAVTWELVWKQILVQYSAF